MAAVQSVPGVPTSQYHHHEDFSLSSSYSPQSTHKSLKQENLTNGGANSAWTPPSSKWSPLCHPRAEAVATEVDGYFLEHWKFPNAKSKKVFLNAGFSRVTCLYFPLAKDDRIHFACRLLTVLFLIDDVLEEMSFAEGEAYNENLIPISRGDVLPNRIF